MRHISLPFVLFAACSHGLGSDGACLSDSEIAALEAPIDQFNQQSFQAALAQKTLTGVTLPITQVMGNGTTSDILSAPTTPAPRTTTWPHYDARTVYQITQQGETHAYVAGAAYDCSGPPDEYVADAQGNISALTRKPNTVSTQTAHACSRTCGCGALIELQNLYRLPDGKSFLGTVELAYDVKALDVPCTGLAP